MKTVAALACLVASCSAFAPAMTVRPAVALRGSVARTAPIVAYEEPVPQDLWWGCVLALMEEIRSPRD